MDLDQFRAVAAPLVHKQYDVVPERKLRLSFKMTGWQAPLNLSFSSDAFFVPWGMPGAPRIGLPERIAVVVGRNGSGKSTLLFRLARVLHGSQKDRVAPSLAKLGTITPPGVGFSRIIAVSYSAFDAFQVPGVGRAERLQIISDLSSSSGRYVFCGLRDVARELQELIDKSDASTAHLDEEAKAAIDEQADEQDWVGVDRQPTTYLKTVEALAFEFRVNVEIALSDDRRRRLLEDAMTTLLGDMSFADISEPKLGNLLGADLEESFKSWSTGHKIVMHTLAALAAHTRQKSIILFDEPETHLHPPLLAAMIHAVRRILADRDAFAVIATHSPVVVQETLRSHVSVVNRVDSQVTILDPKIETYGESFGEIV